MRERFDAGTGLVALGAVLLLVSLFVDWYDPSGTAWSVFEFVDILLALAAGETKRFVWRLTPVQPGTHRLEYRVAAGLTGQAKAVQAGDRVPEREMTVRISTRPASARVDPETGAVVRGR